MIKTLVLSLVFLTAGLVHADVQANALRAPLWSCAINVDIQATRGFPIDIISLVRVWEGQGTAECVTPQGVYIRDIALKITKVGPAIGLDQERRMTFVVPEFGVANWSQLFTSFEFGPSVDATAILVRGEVGLGVTLRSSGGLTLQGALGVGQAIGLKLGVSILGSAEITDLGPAQGLY